MALSILHEDNHLLVVNKPAGLPTQGAKPDEPSLHGLACDYIRRKYRKPGNVYLGVVMRLDACTSGLVVLARTSKAAARLSQQFRERKTNKVYLAVVERSPAKAECELVDWMVKDEPQQRMVIAQRGDRAAMSDSGTPIDAAAKQARLHYRQLQRLPKGRSLLAVTLETGRKHQIRLQLSAHGMPILGDRKYGASSPFAPSAIALHAGLLGFHHPVRHEPLEFRAPLPAAWNDLGIVGNVIDELRGGAF